MSFQSFLYSLLITGLLSMFVLSGAENRLQAPVLSILNSDRDTAVEVSCKERGLIGRGAISDAYAEDETEIVSIAASSVAEQGEDFTEALSLGLWETWFLSPFLIGLFVPGLLALIHREQESQTRQGQEREARAEAILKTTMDGIFTMDAEGTIESFDETAERIFGYETEEVIGKCAACLFVSPPDRRESEQPIRSAPDTERRSILDADRAVTGKRKDGSTFPMYLAVRRVEIAHRTILVGVVRDVSERRRLEKEMLNISERVRRQVGRDLHDGIASQLTAARLILDNLVRMAEEEDTSGMEIARRIRKSRELVAESAGEVRRLSHGLNPVAFSEGKLPAALARLADGEKEARFVMGCGSTGECRKVEVQEEDEVPEWDVCLDDETATNLYWIAQEAFNNAHKHADADEIVIRLAVREEELLLSVEDDGTGFLLSEVDDEGIGLRSMKYRARGLGATISLDSAPGAGTRVSCRFPLR